MAIIHFCDSEEQAKANGCNVKPYSAGNNRTVWTYETHNGLCLSQREMNGRDDSDFYMTVWNTETNAPQEICFASTRGWTYPSMGSYVDATDDIKAAYAAYQQRQRDARAARHAKHEAATPSKGKLVKVIKGRKVPVGTVGRVFWHGAAKEFGSFPRGGYKAHRREQTALVRSLLGPDGNGDKEGFRVGLVTDAGEKYFTAATNVDVIAE